VGSEKNAHGGAVRVQADESRKDAAAAIAKTPKYGSGPRRTSRRRCPASAATPTINSGHRR